MSVQVDHSKPLDDETKRWLHEWSLDWVIEENERIHGKQEGGEPPNVQEALRQAGFEPPPAPPGPTSVAPVGNVATGPVIVEGVNDKPVEPGSGVVTVPVALPRDHAFTAVVDENRTDAVLSEVEGSTAGQTPANEPEAWDAKAVRAEIAELSVDDLKENLKDLEQPVGGNKEELQKRLYAALKKAHDDEAKAAE